MAFKLNIIDLLMKKEPIAGMEIGDDFLRLILLERDAAGKIAVKEAVEEPLAKQTITNGILKNPGSFKDSLKKLLAKAEYPITSLIISLTDINGYSKIFSFPKNISGDKLNSAMRVETSFNLPIKTAEVYLDWETVPSEKENKLYLIAIPKLAVDPYLEIFNELKLKVPAVETRLQSLVRGLEAGDEPILIIIKEDGRTGFAIIKDRAAPFVYFINREITGDELKTEVQKISSYYEVESGGIKKILNADELTLPHKFAEDPRLNNQSKWLSALGAAMRGLLSRSEDTLISLMPIGTEKAYENWKKGAFLRFLSDMAIGVAVVISLAFIAVLIIMASISNRVKSQYSSQVPLPGDIVAIQNRASEFNTLVENIADIKNRLSRWDMVFENFLPIAGGGIVIQSYHSSSPSETIAISGVARTRANLNDFRKALEASPFFTGAQIPLAHLDQINNIPFSLVLKIKSPEVLTQP